VTLPRVAADPIWDDYLEPGEFLVWHGRPNGEKLTSRSSRSRAIMSLGFFIFAGVMVNVTWDDLFKPGIAPLWFIIAGLVAAGLWLLVGSHFRDRRARRGTWYTLTNKRAFIATDLRRRRLESWPIGPDSPLRIVSASDPRLSYIYFAKRIIPASDREGTDTVVEIGFELIEDGDKVWDLFQRVAKGAT